MTRTRAGGNNEDGTSSVNNRNNSNNNQWNNEDNLPPPPSAVDVLACLLRSQSNIEAALRTIAQNTAQGKHHRQGPKPNQYSSYKDFLETNPPVFSKAEDPLQADNWLNTIEQKFRLLRCTKELKAKYAAHQLEGLAGTWWMNYLRTLPPRAQVTWDQFKIGFRGHDIPPGLMKLKCQEF